MREAAPSAGRIAQYYDYMTPYYRFFWHGRTGAVHYGLRGPTTRGSRDELENTNCVLADAACIRAGDRVLDAGCGVGGSSTWIARHRAAQVVGITLSERQLREARRRAMAQRVAHRTRFLLGDYCDTGFADASFDVVWALESSCYEGDRRSFVREACRLLNEGGRIVIGDGFRKRDVASHDERTEYTRFLRGLVLPDLQHIDECLAVLREAGCVDIVVRDVTEAARPSSRRMRRACVPAHFVARALRPIGVFDEMMVSNARAGIAQHRIVESGLAGYFVVTAKRGDAPSRR